MKNTNIKHLKSKKVKEYREFAKKESLKHEAKKLKNELIKVKKLEADIKKLYSNANKEIDFVISNLFLQYSSDDISFFSKLSNSKLTRNELEKFRQEVNNYYKIINAKSPDNYQLLGELYTTSKKRHISRLEKELFLVDKSINELYEKTSDGLLGLLNDTLVENYALDSYLFYKLTGKAKKIKKLSEKVMLENLYDRWSGLSFMETMYKNQQKLRNTVKQEVCKAINQGFNAREIANKVKDKLNSDYKHTLMVVNTEHAFIMNRASYLAYINNDFERYEFVATLDNRTTLTCQELDGKVFKVEDAKVGINYPPCHIRCRSTTIVDFEDNPGERFARDKDGKGIYVDASMKYAEWKSKYMT